MFALDGLRVVTRRSDVLGMLLIVFGPLIAVPLSWASSLDLVADHASLVVEGTITAIHSPLISDRCVANCNPVPDFILKVDRTIFGQLAESSLTIKTFVYNWPTELVPYEEGSRCVVFLNKTDYQDKLALFAVLPAGRTLWSRVSSREALKQEVKSRLMAQLSDAPATRKQAELIHTLSGLLAPQEAEQLFAGYVTSADKLVRHAATGAIVCKAPTSHNIELAKKDIEPSIAAKENDSFTVGTISANGVSQITYSVLYYDCLPGPIPSEKPLADLWHWIAHEDQQRNPDSWPYKKD